MTPKDNQFWKIMLEVMSYSSAAVFAPLVIFLGIGYWLDRIFGSKPICMLIGLGIAFVVTNILLIKKSRKITLKSISLVKKINSEGREKEKEEAEKENKQ